MQAFPKMDKQTFYFILAFRFSTFDEVKIFIEKTIFLDKKTKKFILNNLESLPEYFEMKDSGNFDQRIVDGLRN